MHFLKLLQQHWISKNNFGSHFNLDAVFQNQQRTFLCSLQILFINLKQIGIVLCKWVHVFFHNEEAEWQIVIIKVFITIGNKFCITLCSFWTLQVANCTWGLWLHALDLSSQICADWGKQLELAPKQQESCHPDSRAKLSIQGWWQADPDSTPAAGKLDPPALS